MSVRYIFIKKSVNNNVGTDGLVPNGDIGILNATL